MKKTSQQAPSLFELQESLAPLATVDNRWVKLARLIPWERFEQEYLKTLRNDQAGAGNKSPRVEIGAVIIKHVENLSDEKTIQAIQENPFMQFFLGLDGFTFKPVFDPSLFVTIRKRLGIDFFNALTLAIQEEEERLKAQAGRKDGDGGEPGGDGRGANAGDKRLRVKMDATCCPAEMKYPTDIGLLEDGSRLIERLMARLWAKAGSDVPKRPLWRKQSRAAFLQCVKRKFKGRKLKENTRSTQILCLEHDIEIFLDSVGKYRGDLRKAFRRCDIKAALAAMEMLRQQKAMFAEGTNRCVDRIVSIFQPHVRPIVRGKLSAKTEFGAKIGVAVVNGYSYVDRVSWDAYNECEDLRLHVRKFEERFGGRPEEVFVDKIYLSRQNREWLKENSIACHCAPLGRAPKNPNPEALEKRKIASAERNEVECSFGTGKRVYRADDIRAKLPDTAESWIGACFFAKNLMKFLRELFVSIVRDWNILVKFLHPCLIFEPQALCPMRVWA